MNELQIFEKDQFDSISEFQKSKPNCVVGIVYAIEI